MLASDLHVHLDGSLREDTLVELAVDRGLWPGSLPADELLDGLRFRPGMSLPSCLARFETTTSLLQTASSLARAASELVRDGYLDGVRHSEIRLCPPLHGGSGLGHEEALDAVLRGIDEGVALALAGASDDRLTAAVVVTVLEGMTEDEALDLVDLASRYAGSGVCGVDLAGDESLFDAERYRRAFARAADAGLGIAVHAGEGHDPVHIEEAVEILGARRIGHGTTALADPRVVALLVERGVTLEVCVTSNVHTGSIDGFAGHPLPGLLAAGVRVALATDNRFFSSTTLSREYALVSEELGVGRADIERMVLESASSAFLPKADRAKLVEIYAASLGGSGSGGGGTGGGGTGGNGAGETVD